MSFIVEIEIPVDEFPLGELVQRYPDAHIELEQFVPADDGLLPFFWIRNVSAGEIAETEEEEPALESVTVLDDTGEGLLCRMTWNRDQPGLQDIIVDGQTTLLGGCGSSDGWYFQFRFTTHAAASRLREKLSARSIPFEVMRVYSVQEMRERQYDLTSEQYDALVSTHQAGFFRTPRQATLAEVAQELDITPQALSARYRRGLDSLLESTLYEIDDDSASDV
ncbi:helix-turn-helix domain-containing protein [Haladaptatus cibarius]|uniref:helix-turn-helix domain-containing protein n=1 Tax=Haladaptatus cibarius TaxID=453847 RepID=UPI00067871E1|nr:bacterio-opsin activator domain-containing protein [Haladaptatus cibarius]